MEFKNSITKDKVFTLCLFFTLIFHSFPLSNNVISFTVNCIEDDVIFMTLILTEYFRSLKAIWGKLAFFRLVRDLHGMQLKFYLSISRHPNQLESVASSWSEDTLQWTMLHFGHIYAGSFLQKYVKPEHFFWHFKTYNYPILCSRTYF